MAYTIPIPKHTDRISIIGGAGLTKRTDTLSAELLKMLLIMFCKMRDTSTLFGGVLIIANMDASQFRAIDGLPILLSSHVLTEFVIIALTESVRAHGDPEFCKIQNIFRMSPSLLKGNIGLEYEFKSLCSTCLTFMEN